MAGSFSYALPLFRASCGRRRRAYGAILPSATGCGGPRPGDGATVGQLDENALFYMRARGIAEKEARLLLMFAFVNEVIDTIRLDALKDRLHLLVEKRFRGELNKCQGCAICK